jgi:hypothetical protein
MSMFRKKPVVVEARQFKDTSYVDVEIVRWCDGYYSDNGDHAGSIAIHTLEGVMYASPGDWIIKGVNGEFYPCKPDIFEKTYEPA